MIALEVYSVAIFYFRADISKKIATVFWGVRQIAQQTHHEKYTYPYV